MGGAQLPPSAAMGTRSHQYRGCCLCVRASCPSACSPNFSTFPRFSLRPFYFRSNRVRAKPPKLKLDNQNADGGASHPRLLFFFSLSYFYDHEILFLSGRIVTFQTNNRRGSSTRRPVWSLSFPRNLFGLLPTTKVCVTCGDPPISFCLSCRQKIFLFAIGIQQNRRIR